MLKTIQIIGLCSSSSSSSAAGFVTLTRLKQNPPNHASNYLASLSLIPFSNSRKPIKTIVTTTDNRSSLSSKGSIFTFPKEKGHFYFTCRSCKMSSTHSGSNPTGASPSPPSLTAAAQSTGSSRKNNFCQWCGGPTKHEIPDGEERIRAICTLCGKIAYENPKMVVGCLIEHDQKILLCKRKIQPSYGLWTLPAGYMEIGESAAEGASRETREEANAEVEIVSPFAQLDIPLIGQTYVIFLARLKTPNFSPGVESSECRLFTYDEIPFDTLAFSSMLVSLKLYLEDIKVGRPKFHYGIINKRPGTSPSAINAYTLDHHMVS